ncbi:transglycosylase SLT domain-containing protein [Altererythrobacter sp.]|uniref:lytic transglycosylase domain-containing protein n=1 Tax=Altererythrobacter sp. TaxID=1872480 RepID=UPI003D104253
MSSMHRNQYRFALILGTAALACAAPLLAQDLARQNRATVQMVAQQPQAIMRAVDRFDYLANTKDLGFDSYAGFVLAYPGFPKEELLRTRAENALDNEAPSTEALLAFFDRNPPLTNSGRARYALALAAKGRPEAKQVAREAWRGGSMSGTAEAYILGMFASSFTQEDNDARMDALLWQGDAKAARRHQLMVSADKRARVMARLALVEDHIDAGDEVAIPSAWLSDPGVVYNLVKYYRANRQMPRAVALLTSRPRFSSLPFDPEALVGEMLQVAKGASSGQAANIAASVDDLFAPGADISDGSYRLRDRYTDLMWLGGTKALWSLGDGARAAPLFYRYGMAAKTPLTRSKGLYWAGRAARQAGKQADAERYFTAASQYADQYYGQLALGALGKPMPQFAKLPQAVPTPEQRAEFANSPLVKALKAIATNRRNWRTERAFFGALADSADTPEKMALVADLAHQLKLDEFAVVAGATAPEHGLTGFERLAHPTVQVPYGTDWTMAHAIMRQESEFDRTRVSHAGARGMMQLMPGTAREQAGKMGMNYMSADLTADPQYNIRLGDAYFRRLLDYYGGAYPLAIGAYNAGPGRVNQWLRMNGDPRTGAIDYVTWIEKIPANFETRYYIMRVLGNAVAYDNMNPDKAPGGRPRTIANFLR